MARKSALPAYTKVDLSRFTPEQRAILIEDAATGGAEYGIRVVEEVINGGASFPLYGWYHTDEVADKKWTEAREELGISDEEIDEDQLDEAARVSADAEAARIRAAEEAREREITHTDPPAVKNKR